MEFQIYSTDPDPQVQLDRAWVEVDILDEIDDVDALAAELGIRPMSYVEFGVVPDSDEELVRMLTSVVGQVAGDLVLLTDSGEVLLRRTEGRVQTSGAGLHALAGRVGYL